VLAVVGYVAATAPHGLDLVWNASVRTGAHRRVESRDGDGRRQPAASRRTRHRAGDGKLSTLE
jgi:hypothetical protein